MNKIAAIAGAVVLLAGGYYLGNANQPEPTVIKVPTAPKAEFASEGSSEVAAASGKVSVPAMTAGIRTQKSLGTCSKISGVAR